MSDPMAYSLLDLPENWVIYPTLTKLLKGSLSLLDNGWKDYEGCKIAYAIDLREGISVHPLHIVYDAPHKIPLRL